MQRVFLVFTPLDSFFPLYINVSNQLVQLGPSILEYVFAAMLRDMNSNGAPFETADKRT